MEFVLVEALHWQLRAALRLARLLRRQKAWAGRPVLCSKLGDACISQVLIWDLSSTGQHHTQKAAWTPSRLTTRARMTQLQWGIMLPVWVAICF